MLSLTKLAFFFFFFFLKALRSTRESFKILYVYVDRTQCKRDCSSSLEMRHTETLTPHARAHTPTHTPQHPVEKSRIEQSSNAGPAASTPRVRANRATLGSPKLAFFEAPCWSYRFERQVWHPECAAWLHGCFPVPYPDNGSSGKARHKDWLVF